MANLLDTIRQNQNALTEQPGVTDETAKLQTLMRAKSGKAVGGSPVASSNLQEQSAVAQTGQQLGQVKQQANVAQAGLQQQQAGQQLQQKQAEQQVNQAMKFDNIQNRLKTDELLSDLQRNKGQVDLQSQQAQLEQVGFNLRMQNTKYVDDLQREGAKARLDKDLQFRQSLQDSIYGDSQDLMEETLGNKDILAASDRDFNKSMAQMNIDSAYDMMKQDLKSQKERGLYEGLGALTTAGIGGYGAYESSQAKKPQQGSK